MKIEDIKKFANYYFPRVSYLAQSQPKITSKLLKYIYAKKKIHRNSKSLKYNISRISYVILSKHTSCHSTKLPPPPLPIIYLSKITARFKTLRRSHTFSSRKNKRRKSRTCQTKVKPLCLQRKPIDSLRIFLATRTIRRTPLIAWKKWKSLFRRNDTPYGRVVGPITDHRPRGHEFSCS